MDKTPLGVTPKYIWDEQRMVDLTDAIERYQEAGMDIPVEWVSELAEVTMIVVKDIAKREGKTVDEVVRESIELHEALESM